MHDAKKLFWDVPYVYRNYVDGIIRHCVSEIEILRVLESCHSSRVGGFHSDIQIAHKILQCGYYWPTIHKDAHEFSKACDRCRRNGSISLRQELPLNLTLVVEFFDVWCIDMENKEGIRFKVNGERIKINHGHAEKVNEVI